MKDYRKCDTFLPTDVTCVLYLPLFRTQVLSPRLPNILFAAPNGLHWCLNNAHWLTIPHGQTHNVVAFLRLEFAIGDCGQHLPIEVRGQGGFEQTI